MKVAERLPDPHGFIARVRGRLPKNCAVALSPFCDTIIAMRMQGVPFRDIEKWLVEQGPEYRVPSPTIYRNLKRCRLQVDLPYAEELAERWGGRIDLDLVRELSGMIVVQRQRIDKLVRGELNQQKNNPRYHDKRISREIQTLESLTKTLQVMLKNPDEAVEERMKADKMKLAQSFDVSPEALTVIKDLILGGGLNPKRLATDGESIH